LVRKICPDCKVKKPITEDEINSLAEILPEKTLIQVKNKTFYQGTGCEKCDKSGYYSRIGIYEVLEIDDNIREAVIRRADASEIRDIAVKNGMTMIIEDGFQKAINGITTIEEILRVIHE
jgi:type II secretory ATPase GspE/PulE/Tfp pilus assembly ATPase PilB-like protein